MVLTGAAILGGGVAAADPNQDDRFLALLDQQGIPALRGVPSLIDTAHDVCRTLDAGMPAAGLVDAMVNNAVGIDPSERNFDPGRLARTEARFITAAVGAYCPYDRGKLASIKANAAGWHESGMIGTPAGWHQLIGPVPSGEIDDPNPPQLPAQPPTAAQIQTPRQAVAAPPPPRQPPPPPQKVEPPPQQPPPPPQQVEPPAVGPQPGEVAGSGGGGGSGNRGGIPADPSPGFVRLAP
jgi:hypothetical protein